MITLSWPARPFLKRMKRRRLSEIAFLDAFGSALPAATR
jgi:hypothetical protein